MRLANLAGRAILMLDEARGVDVCDLSRGAYGPSMPSVYDHWSDFVHWAAAELARVNQPGSAKADARSRGRVTSVVPERLGPPSPAPRQIFAIGRNYHTDRSLLSTSPPDLFPPTFTKFVSSLAGPRCEVVLPEGGSTDWEAELVVIIGVECRQVAEADAWGVVAGLCVGQDLSERKSQMAGPTPQFSLAKSYPHFAPAGPWLVTPDELPDPDDIRLGCILNGEDVQRDSTRAMIFPVPSLISRLSETVTLYPGGMIFTGTPQGVGQHRKPPRFLAPGDDLKTWADGIGHINQRFCDG